MTQTPTGFADLWLAALGSYMWPTLGVVLALIVGITLYVHHRHGAQRWELPDFLPWSLGAVVLILTLGLYARHRMPGSKPAPQDFAGRIESIQSAIGARIGDYDAALKAARDFVLSQSPDALLWDSYARQHRAKPPESNWAGVGYVAYVRQADLRPFLAEVRRLRSDFALMPRGRRPAYAIVQYLEPAESNAWMLGFDLAVDTGTWPAAEQSRDLDEMTVTPPIPWPQPGSSDRRRDVVLFRPVYSQNASSIEERVGALKGWVVARVHIEDLFKDIGDEGSTDFQWELFAGDQPSADALVFQRRMPVESAAGRGTPVIRTMTYGGRHWTLRAWQTAAAVPASGTAAPGSSGSSAPTWILGILLALLAPALVWAITSARRRAEAMARGMTADLQQRTAALSAVPHAVVIADALEPDLPVLWVNGRFELTTGYSPADILGKNCRVLQGTDRDQKELQDLRRALRDQRDGRALLRNYKKDGSPFWNELTVTPVRNAMGKVVQWVGMLQDVTEREQADRRLATQVNVIRALAESTTVEEASSKVLQALCEGQEWDIGAFWLVDRKMGALRCADFWRQPELEAADFERMMRETTFPKEVGFPGHVWAKGEAVWVGDLRADHGFPETGALSSMGVSSAVGFPVANRNGLQGVMTFYSRRIWPLNKNQLLLMVTTATQVSQFIDRQAHQKRDEDVGTLERGLAEFMGDGLLAMDREGFCIFANPAASKMLGYSIPLLQGQNVHDLLHPERGGSVCERPRCPLLLSLQSTQSHYVDRGQAFARRDESLLPVALTTSPIIDQGLIRGVVVTFNDVSERRAEEERVEKKLLEQEQALQKALADVDQYRTALAALPEKTNGHTPDAPPAPEMLTVLLVEEDAGLANRVITSLRRKNVDVLHAGSVEEAERLCADRTSGIDLLITDLMLSQMTGKTLADHLRATVPDLKVLFTSSYSANAVTEMGILKDGMPFLRKPLAPEALRAQVEQLTGKKLAGD